MFVSQGVPMICHGDELGRTQRGNNNAYCQDNELTWIDWSKIDDDLLLFSQRIAALRREHPVFRRRRFFSGKPVGRRGEAGLPDIAWFAPDGSEMTGEDWGAGFSKSVAVYLNGHGIPDRDTRGQQVIDDSFVLCFNAHHEPIEFTLPPAEFGSAWNVVLDTTTPELEGNPAISAATAFTVGARAAVVLQAAPVQT
jgi:glycogen operon protein